MKNKKMKKMKKMFLVLTTISIIACKPLTDVSVNPNLQTSLVDVVNENDVSIDAMTTVQARKCHESHMALFCRPDLFSNFEQHRNNMRSSINLLLNEGWSYAGPLHNDGINCQNNLFIREITCQIDASTDSSADTSILDASSAIDAIDAAQKPK
jgi:hypothetical protein